MFERFTFDPDITETQKSKLLERHAVAVESIAKCASLDEPQRQNLMAKYQGPISHGISANPDAYAEAYVGGMQIWINFDLLFSRGDTEITQTLIHEMMHCAGYSHPKRGASDVPMLRRKAGTCSLLRQSARLASEHRPCVGA